eukprot:TRINITY_DN55244_c0_g1_i3.p1 TRINITY_DN55244_c0_g1~~TRINITY_DN55244_c0_g1_i3.p1  ORF type:complete len:288 (-),score=-10.36 TRINITY_DN55244_c0_g1_i3:209-1072(-)
MERPLRNIRVSRWFSLDYVFDWLVGIAIWIFNAIVVFGWKPPHWPFRIPTSVVAPTDTDTGALQTNDTHNWWDNRYDFPHRPDSVKVWLSAMHGILLPLVVFIALFIKNRSLHDLHHSCLGLFLTITTSYAVSLPIAHGVGKWRPDYLWRLENLNTEDAHLSFPSGHTTLAFGSMVFLTLWSTGKLHTFNAKSGEMWKVVVGCFTWMSTAVAIGCSRITDFRHHPIDVFAGAVIGTLSGSLIYHMYYPPLNVDWSHLPKSYKRYACLGTLANKDCLVCCDSGRRHKV